METCLEKELVMSVKIHVQYIHYIMCILIGLYSIVAVTMTARYSTQPLLLLLCVKFFVWIEAGRQAIELNKNS